MPQLFCRAILSSASSLCKDRGIAECSGFALVTTHGEAVGPVAFMRPDFKPGDTIPQGKGRSLQVTAVIEADRAGELPMLVVEPAGA